MQNKCVTIFDTPVFTRANVNEIFSDVTVQASVFTHRFVDILFLVLGCIEPSPRSLFSRSLFQRLASRSQRRLT